MLLNYRDLQSSLGRLRVAACDNKLVGLWFYGQKYEFQPFAGKSDVHWQRDDDGTFLNIVSGAVDRYFSGEDLDCDIALRLTGTSFQRLVWTELRNISPGQTVSYGELAARLGRSQAVRAVEAAVGRNPLSVIVPCHRVIGANGSLTGYAGGLERKRQLLAHEAKAAASMEAH